VAADLLSQAEHDKNATAVLVTDSRDLAEAVSAELEVQIAALSRSEIARVSVDNNGKIIITDSIDQAIEVANGLAPEHLEICVDEPFKYLDKIKNAGSIFMGKYCPEALGDYFAGPNHTLPTSGYAHAYSGVNLDSFCKKITFQRLSQEGLKGIGNAIQIMAENEDLLAHKLAVTVRLEEIE
jgi:histidinol dehydrogenase